jgi:hypothetical protein
VEPPLLADRAFHHHVVARRRAGQLEPQLPVDDPLDHRPALLQRRDQKPLFRSQKSIDESNTHALHD